MCYIFVGMVSKSSAAGLLYMGKGLYDGRTLTLGDTISNRLTQKLFRITIILIMIFTWGRLKMYIIHEMKAGAI